MASASASGSPGSRRRPDSSRRRPRPRCSDTTARVRQCADSDHRGWSCDRCHCMLSAGTGGWNGMTPSRYSQQIDLGDVNNAHSLGILLVPDGSRVLDIGTADGSVARALADRGCSVWGIEVDADAARDAERWCDRVIVGDVEQLDWQASMDGQLFDVVLLLDVLEHLRDPLQTLRRAVSFLAPGGRIVASIPNVAHAAVRLQLLDGRFERTDIGLLDRTHIQFFDRRSVD